MSDIVKRLRVRRNPMLDSEREEAADEIERLRSALRERDMSQMAQSAWPEHCEIERPSQDRGLHTEIERLRDHIKFLNSFRPDAELARLRGLLREGLRKHENYPGGYAAITSEPGLFEYWKRVREALGDD